MSLLRLHSHTVQKDLVGSGAFLLTVQNSQAWLTTSVLYIIAVSSA